jgi:hypothetical protein
MYILHRGDHSTIVSLKQILQDWETLDVYQRGNLLRVYVTSFLRMTAPEIATYEIMRLRLQKREVEWDSGTLGWTLGPSALSLRR